MSESVPARIHQQQLFDQFWEQLRWDVLEKKIRIALRQPGVPITTEINCPAVMDLARQIVGGIGESAIQRPGAPVSPQETFSSDQKLVLLRILEAIISEYEEWKKRRFSQGTTPAVSTKFPPLDIK
jgi:hypothetical protein